MITMTEIDEAKKLKQAIEKGAVHSLVIPGEPVRQEIIAHFSAELDHNEKWVLIHKAEGDIEASKRRQAHCRKLLRWLEWLHLAAPVATAKPRTRFCWLCNRKLRGNHHVEKMIDGHPRILHKDCGKRAEAGLAEEG